MGDFSDGKQEESYFNFIPLYSRKAWEGGEENYPEATAATFNGFGLFFAWCVGPCPVNTDIGGREVESYS